MVRLSPIAPQPQAQIVIPQDRPVYRIKQGKFFGPDDNLYEEGAVIAWKDEPNLEMEPLNALAQEKYTAFLKKLDKAGREVAEKTGKAWTSLADAHSNSYDLAKQESKGFEVLSGKKQIPLMGAKKKLDSIEEVSVTGSVAAPLLSEPKTRAAIGKGETVGLD
jgi:hypothetical protein